MYILNRNNQLFKSNFICGKLFKNSIKYTCSYYEKAISALNSLQSNAVTLERVRKSKSKTICDNIDRAQKYLERIELGQNDLKKLNIIHVSGTKGKGSTCAFIESILHEHGYKVGFYSSPHLVVARERIRIGKRIISEGTFTDNFWNVYELLKSKQSFDGDMPAYFKFLTLLAFQIFIKEEVDVAIIEVGIGGEYDCTNVIRNPVVCGITCLDYDHTAILGNTLESIAWQKAGIMKPGVPTFTVEHTTSSLEVMKERAIEKQSTLLQVPELKKYLSSEDINDIQLGLDGSVQLVNASLALQLSHYWMNEIEGNNELRIIDDCRAKPFNLSKRYLNALKNVTWPGRSQVFHSDSYTYFIDGAHTIASMAACVEWFKKSSSANLNGSSSFKVLIFNITGDRDPLILLEQLRFLKFNLAIFTTNMVTGSMDISSDQISVGVSEEQQVETCQKMKSIWESMNKNNIRSNGDLYKTLNIIPSITFSYIQNAVDWLLNKDNLDDFGYLKDSSVQILVTGSMHLVGGVLAVIDPEMSTIENPLKLEPVLKKNVNNRNI